MRLILIRHGESEGNATGIVQGRLDFGLTERGRAQARATASRLAEIKVDRLVSSPLLRAAQTAEIISDALALPVEHDDRLMEYDIGEASGLTGPQIRERFPEFVAQWQKGIRPTFPGEEGRDVFHGRLRAVLEHHRTVKETVVAVAHGGVVSGIGYQVLGMDIDRRGAFQTANCGITEVVADRQGKLVLLRLNDTCHLDGLLTSADRG